MAITKLKDTHVYVTVFRLSLERSKQKGDVHLVKKQFKKFLNSSHSSILEVWEELDDYSVFVRGPEEETLRKQVDKFRQTYAQKHGLNWLWDVKFTKEELDYDLHLTRKFKKDLQDKEKEINRLKQSASRLYRDVEGLEKDKEQLTITAENLLEQLDEKSKDTNNQNWLKTFTEFRENNEASEQKLKEEHEKSIREISNEFYVKADKLERTHFKELKSLKNLIKDLKSKIKDRDDWVEESNQKYEDADAENVVLREEIKSLKLKNSQKSVFRITWDRFRNLFRSK